MADLASDTAAETSRPASPRGSRRVGGPGRAALRRLADHERVQPRLPPLHRGERAGQGVSRRARPGAGVRRHRPADGQRGPVPVLLGRRAHAAPAVLRHGRARVRARRAAQDRDERPLPFSGELRADEGARRQGRAGEPRRRVRADVPADARARRASTRPWRGCATCARRRFRWRSTSRRHRSMRTRSARPSISPTSSARTVSTPGARCTPATRSRRGGISSCRTPTTTRSSTCCGRRRCNTAAACASTSTRRDCSRNCAIACSIRPRS